MSITHLNWSALTFNPTFTENFETVQFFDFQTNAQQVLTQLIKADFGSLLVIKSETFPEYIAEINQFFTEKNIKVVTQMQFEQQSLLGYHLYLPKENKIETIKGEIQSAINHILMLNLKALNKNLSLWDSLKQALLYAQLDLPCANALPQKMPKIETPFKLILIGDRDDIATLYQYDNSLYQFAHYTEIESYLKIENNIQQWVNYLYTASEKYLANPLAKQAIYQFMQAYIRESETQSLLSISPTQIKKDLLGIKHYYSDQASITDVFHYFEHLEQQASPLNQYVKQDILTEQLHIDTENEIIGQINGLSVIEVDGLPFSFGEPLRISCNVQMGDGEIADIERKVELAGSIHAKGIMIAQSCLSHLLEFPAQLPFSASLAFEQSYGEVDGDSSALAIFCVLLSALAKLPISQQIAVTGSIDQFGNVLSVGGVNQKIEGFFDLCQARELTGKQGVIIPQSCLSHLSLNQQVVNSVKAGKFHIWTVETIFDAVELLFQRPFYADDEETETTALFDLIHSEIEHGNSHTSGSIFSKIYKIWHK